MAVISAIFATLYLAQIANAQPVLSFPFNAQLPLAARIGTFYSYSFSSHTFSSGSNITYSFGSNHPKWLSIDSDERRLYGTPKDGDVPPGQVVGQKLDIVATDTTGSTSMSATLVVSRSKAPTVQIPIEKQIEDFGNFSAPSSVLSYPDKDFSYSFDQKTFGSKVAYNYYAVSADNSPLPAWIQFNPDTLTFSGKTPPIESLVQPPQSFELALVASDIVGFSATKVPFSIVVGIHKLTTSSPILSINATRGSKVDYDGLASGIELDKKPAKLSDLKVTTSGMPNWLSYDGGAAKLVGTPGKGDHSTNFTITFKDQFSDALDVIIIVNIASGLFESTFDDMRIRPGERFSLDLAGYLKNPEDTTVKITTSPQQTWLGVDGLKVSGTAPKNANGNFDMTIDATSQSSKATDTEEVHVTYLSPEGTMSTTSSVSRTSESTTKPTTENHKETHTGIATAEASRGRLSSGDILLATVIPVLSIALGVTLLVCFFRRRRARRNYLASGYRSKISKPILTNMTPSSTPPPATMAGAVQSEKQLYKPTPVRAATVDAVPQTQSFSAVRRSSETLGVDSLPSPPGLVAEDGQSTIRSVSPPRTICDRQSWETVEGEAIGRAKSTYSQGSDTTFPESTRQLFPSSSFQHPTAAGAFRREIEPAVPTAHPAPLELSKAPSQHRVKQSFDTLATANSGPVSIARGKPVPIKVAAPIVVDTEASEPNWEMLTKADDSGSMRVVSKPKPVALASPTTGGARAWQDENSSNGSKSVRTDPSFSSTENWRVIKRDQTNLTQMGILEEPSPVKWGRDRADRESEIIPSFSGMTMSSGHSSGGSFKVFL